MTTLKLLRPESRLADPVKTMELKERLGGYPETLTIQARVQEIPYYAEHLQAIAMGLRVFEVLALKWLDVDWKH